MSGIDLMVQEHEHILKFVDIIRSACCRVLDGFPVDADDFQRMLTFARTYADHHHHGKEEQILFREMRARLGQTAKHLIQHGMLVEHDMGRFHIAELESALERYKATGSTMDKLEILTHAAGWANLLQRHIEKENNAVYTFAKRMLPSDVLKQIDAESEAFEEAERANTAQALTLLEQLSETYL